MIRKKIKFQNVFLLIGALLILPLIAIATISQTNLKDDFENETDYVTEEVITDSLPVVNTTTRIIDPYTDKSVTVGKSYYDYKGEETAQINSILKQEDTYIQNKGIDFVSENKFEVIAILDGTVQEINEDSEQGKSIEIKHENGFISVYQSLSEINVKKGDIVNQGQVLGLSGTTELYKELGNHLHFEIYENSIAVNPENYLNKEVSLKKGN